MKKNFSKKCKHKLYFWNRLKKNDPLTSKNKKRRIKHTRKLKIEIGKSFYKRGFKGEPPPKGTEGSVETRPTGEGGRRAATEGDTGTQPPPPGKEETETPPTGRERATVEEVTTRGEGDRWRRVRRPIYHPREKQEVNHRQTER